MALLTIVPVKDALVAFLKATMSNAYGKPVDVQESGSGDFDNDGQLVLKKIAIRVRFGDGEFGQTRDITRTTLSSSLYFQVVCAHGSLRSENEQRDRTLELAACAVGLLGGTRLVLPDGTRSEPILVRGVAQMSDAYGPVADCYGVSIEVGGFLQLSGEYAAGFSVAGGAQ